MDSFILFYSTSQGTQDILWKKFPLRATTRGCPGPWKESKVSLRSWLELALSSFTFLFYTQVFIFIFRSTDWNQTHYGQMYGGLPPAERGEANMVLPLVMHHLTPVSQVVLSAQLFVFFRYFRIILFPGCRLILRSWSCFCGSNVFCRFVSPLSFIHVCKKYLPTHFPS